MKTRKCGSSRDKDACTSSACSTTWSDASARPSSSAGARSPWCARTSAREPTSSTEIHLRGGRARRVVRAGAGLVGAARARTEAPPAASAPCPPTPLAPEPPAPTSGRTHPRPLGAAQAACRLSYGGCGCGGCMVGKARSQSARLRGCAPQRDVRNAVLGVRQARQNRAQYGRGVRHHLVAAELHKLLQPRDGGQSAANARVSAVPIAPRLATERTE